MGTVCTTPKVEAGNQELEVSTAAKPTLSPSTPTTVASAADTGPRAAESPTDNGAATKQTGGQAQRAEPPIAAAKPQPTEEGFQARRWRETFATAGVNIKEVPGRMQRRPSSENITLDTYAAKHAGMFQRLLELDGGGDWHFKREEQEVKIFVRAEPGKSLYYFKGVTDVKVDGGLPRLLSVLLDTEERPKWDELCVNGATEQYYPPYYKISHTKFAASVKVVCPREMVIMGRFRFEMDGSIIIAMQSVEYPEMPSDPEYVRAEFVEGGYIIRPKPGTSNEYTISWIGCVDPKGWVPAWVANIVAPKQTLTLAKFKKFL